MRLNDVTLREGDQMPGRSYTESQKVAAGTTLDDLGVDFIQAGFPVTGEKDQSVIATLSERTEAAVIGLARARTGDIDAALSAQADVVEVFLSISDTQLEHVLGMDRVTALDMLRDAITYIQESAATAHLSLADAFRADPEHLIEVFEEFPDVEYITLADTVGVRTPRSVRSYLERLEAAVDMERVGVHFHDDMGVATANLLTAYEAGVGKADVSVASLGERAGNPALEEVVVAGATEYDDSFGVAESRLVPSCTDILETLEESVQPRKAVLGEEVTEHESGIHTAAMLDEPSVFEPFDPSQFGGERRLLFGEGTGQTGARKLLERAGFEPTEQRIQRLSDRLTEVGPIETSAAVDLASRICSEE